MADVPLDSPQEEEEDADGLHEINAERPVEQHEGLALAACACMLLAAFTNCRWCCRVAIDCATSNTCIVSCWHRVAGAVVPVASLTPKHRLRRGLSTKVSAAACVPVIVQHTTHANDRSTEFSMQKPSETQDVPYISHPARD